MKAPGVFPPLLATLVGFVFGISVCSAQSPVEIRFYNSTSVNAAQLQILPFAGAGSTLTDVTGNYVYWDANSAQTLNGTSSNRTLALSSLAYTDLGGGRGYYSVYSSNFNSASWYIGVNAPALTFSAAAPSPSNPSSNWGGYTYQPFELTLDGSPDDEGDITYINQVGLPMQMRTFVAGATTPSFTTGFTGPNVSAKFQQMAAAMQASFPNAFVAANPSSGNPSGLAIVSAPNSATPGTLNSIAGGNQSFQPLTDYFNKIKASQGNGSVTTIKDFINLTQTVSGANQTYSYAYDFKLDPLGTTNTLKLSGNVSVTAGAGGTFSGNFTGLSITIGNDDLSDPTNSNYWASSFAYLAPTPANVTGGLFPQFTLGGNWTDIATSTGYSSDLIGNSTNLFANSMIGRVMGDLAAGLAFGFVDSDVLNPNYLSGNVTYGASPSGSWWGGNEYPASDANSLMYADVQPNLSSGNNTFYSEYAGILFETVPLAYGHPISDRMQYFKDVQIPVYAVVNGNSTQYIDVIEIEFWDGVNVIPEPSILALFGVAGVIVLLARGKKRFAKS